jgi:hypothetical protein
MQLGSLSHSTQNLPKSFTSETSKGRFAQTLPASEALASLAPNADTTTLQPNVHKRMGAKPVGPSWLEKHQQGVQALGQHFLDNWTLIKHRSAPLPLKALASAKLALNLFGILTAIHGGFLVMPAFWSYVGGVFQGSQLPLLSRLPELPHQLPKLDVTRVKVWAHRFTRLK